MRRLATLGIVLAAAALTAAGQQPFAITNTSPLPTAIFGQPYVPVILQTANGTGPVAWSFVSGSVPSGFVVGPPPSGQPNTNGTFCRGFVTANGPPFCTGNVYSVP